MNNKDDYGIVDNDGNIRSADAQTAAAHIGNMIFSAWLRSIVSTHCLNLDFHKGKLSETFSSSYMSVISLVKHIYSKK